MLCAAFSEFARFLQTFEKFPRGPNLLHYLTLPLVHLTNLSEFITECYKHLKNRTPFSDVPKLGFPPQETGIFKKRFDVIRTNNKLYSLALISKPTIQNLTDFAEIDPCWSLLWAVKLYLHHNLELAKDYYGILPLGSAVIQCFNSLQEYQISGTPTYVDHKTVQEFTNRYAHATGCTPLYINDLMYLEGMKMRSGNTETQADR